MADHAVAYFDGYQIVAVSPKFPSCFAIFLTKTIESEICGLLCNAVNVDKKEQ